MAPATMDHPDLRRGMRMQVELQKQTIFGSGRQAARFGSRRQFKIRSQEMDEVFAWLLWYNRSRLHSTLADASPKVLNKTGSPLNTGNRMHELGHGTRLSRAWSVRQRWVLHGYAEG
jgi:hypothetical protein